MTVKQASNDRLSAWRASRQKRLPLPSGLSVLVRKVELLDLVGSKAIPAPLLAEIQQSAKPGDDVATIGLETLVEVMPMINEVVLAAVIDPPMARQADNEHLGLDELPMNDKLAIFNWTQEEVAALAGFREGSTQPVDSAQLGDGIRDEAEPDPGTEE